MSADQPSPLSRLGRLSLALLALLVALSARGHGDQRAQRLAAAAAAAAATVWRPPSGRRARAAQQIARHRPVALALEHSRPLRRPLAHWQASWLARCHGGQRHSGPPLAANGNNGSRSICIRSSRSRRACGRRPRAPMAHCALSAHELCPTAAAATPTTTAIAFIVIVIVIGCLAVGPVDGVAAAIDSNGPSQCLAR